MRTIHHLCFRLGLALLTIAGVSYAQEIPDFRDLENVVREELRETNVPGAAVAVIRGDRVLFAKGFGVANVETGEPVTTGRLFQVGSVTKTLTAAALVSIAEQGKVRLDAPIGSYLNGFGPRLSQVTLHQLLSQTSGLRDVPGQAGLHDEAALGDSVRSWKDDVFLLDGGKAFSYSNLGYALAGYVLERVTGKPYADAMREILFDPLGMTRSTFRPTMAMTHPLVLGHSAEGREKPSVARPMADDTRLWPAGYLFASLDDLARFVIALMNDGRVDGRQALPRGVGAKMLVPRIEIPTNVFVHGQYGYGLFLHDRYRQRTAFHPGTSPGYTAEIRMVPEQSAAVILLSNLNGARLEKTFSKAFELLLPLEEAPRTPSRPALTMTEEEMRRYAGTYSNRWDMDVFVRDGKLFLRRFGEELPVTKIGENRFSVHPEGLPNAQEFVIVPGADGRPGYLQMFLWVFKKEK
ncbi:MAG TPA: serine hydrolase [Thermoanaerobaculia bacterium]